MDEKKYDIKFHFPYNSISVTADERHMTWWKKKAMAKEPFLVNLGATEFLVNSDMLTFMEIGPALPF